MFIDTLHDQQWLFPSHIFLRIRLIVRNPLIFNSFNCLTKRRTLHSIRNTFTETNGSTCVHLFNLVSRASLSVHISNTPNVSKHCNRKPAQRSKLLSIRRDYSLYLELAKFPKEVFNTSLVVDGGSLLASLYSSKTREMG